MVVNRHSYVPTGRGFCAICKKGTQAHFPKPNKRLLMSIEPEDFQPGGRFYNEEIHSKRWP